MNNNGDRCASSIIGFAFMRYINPRLTLTLTLTTDFSREEVVF